MKEILQNNESYDDLIIRYLDGYASESEKQDLEAWLKASDDNQKEFDAFKKIWGGAADAGVLSQLEIDQDWNQLSSNISFDKNARVRPLWNQRLRSIAAGFILVLLASTIYFYLNNSHQAFEEILLSDGSIVWLQEGSELNYPANFEGDHRKVELKGQAFFDISHNPQMPFIIEANQAKIEVLGTSFNVKTGVEQTEVIVESGSVRVAEKQDTSTNIVLSPAEKGILTNQAIVKTKNDNPNYLAWKTGVFTFEETNLETVLKDLEDYYPETFELSPNVNSNCGFTATFEKETPKTIAEALQFACGLKVQKKRGRYLISN